MLLGGWLALLFLGVTLLVFRFAVAQLPSLPTPAHPLKLLIALVVSVVGGALLAGFVTLYPTAGLFLLAATAPLEEVLYISIGSFRVKPYEAMLLGLVVALLVRGQLRLDRQSGVLGAYVLFGVVSVGFDIGAPLFTSLQVIAFEALMVLIFITTRASVQLDVRKDEPPWVTRLRTEVEWALAPLLGRFFMRFSTRFSRPASASSASSAPSATDDATARYLERARRLTVFYVLVVGNLVTLYGLGQFVGYYLGLPIPYFHPELYAIFRPYSTFIEPNPFGTYLTGQFALSLALVISPVFRRWRPLLIASLALQFAVLAINLSRGSWLAAALVVLVVVVIQARRAPGRQHDLKRLGLFLAGAAVALAVAIGLLLIGDPAVLHTIGARLSSITNLNDGTLEWRSSDFLLALQAWVLKPVIGYGPGTWGSAAYGYVGATAVTAPRNIITAWLYERGLVGALLAIGFYKLFIERAINAYRVAPPGQFQTMILAYGMAALAVFIGFLSASEEIVPYYWFQLGVLAALADLALLWPTTTAASSTAPPPAQLTDRPPEKTYARRT